jgi:hypothetical protein
MGKFLTDEELISTINHSSTPYIIIEGPDDVMIYRWILEDIGCTAFLEPRRGCEGVRKIYDRRNEIKSSNVIFICDRDAYVYTNKIPSKYKGIIYTKGYSIENDLYYGRAIEKKLFEEKDTDLFEKALNSFIRYYACELEKMRNGQDYNFREKPEAIINHKDFSLKVTQLSDFIEPSSKTVEYLKQDYDLLLRGHSLFKLVRMILHRKNRKIQYEEKALYEICYKLCKSRYILSLQRRIKKSLTL